MFRARFAVLAALLASISSVAAQETAGYREDTRILESDGEICPGSVLLQYDDGDFENGYTWRFMGIVPPDYGSWATCYESDFVCGIQFLFTQTGYHSGEGMDVYVWESDAVGNPPPGPDPGNVICVILGVVPEQIAFWPEISTHDVQVCCQTDGDHFVGYWPAWPLNGAVWFVAGDEDGPGGGCPRTKIAPDIGYPSGWQHPEVVATFSGCQALGIREYSGLGDCAPTPARTTTWGRVKALY